MNNYYDGYKFSSHNDLLYYKELEKKDNILAIYYNVNKPLFEKPYKYTPKFIVIYDKYIEMVDIKNYSEANSPKSLVIAREIAKFKVYDFQKYISSIINKNTKKQVIYKKLCYINNVGFVDESYDIKKDKEDKIKEENIFLHQENKKLKKELADYEKFISLLNRRDEIRRDEERWLIDFKSSHNVKFIKRKKMK